MKHRTSELQFAGPKIRIRACKKITEKHKEDIENLLLTTKEDFGLSFPAQNKNRTNLFKVCYGGMLRQKFILAMNGDKVVGFISYIQRRSIRNIFNKPCVYISAGVVDHEYINTEIIRRLIAKLFFVKQGRQIIARTWDANIRSIDMFKELGFRPQATIPTNNGTSVMYYRKDLTKLKGGNK